MTHILQLVDTLQVGGAQKWIACFAQEALRRGIDVSVVSLSDITGKIPAEELQANGVPVTVFPARHLADPKRIAGLLHFLRSQPFDLVHTHLSYGNILGGLAGRWAGLPVIETLHSSGDDQAPLRAHPFSSPRSQAETFSLRFFASRVMAVGDAVAQSHRSRIGRKPIAVIPNAVPLPPTLSSEERQARRQQILDNPGQTLLISVGRFAVVKEFPEMISAFQIIKSLHPEVKLVLIGDGSERPQVEALIDQLKLRQDVILLGRRSDVSQWLQASDLYLSSSSLEGLPISILEAMAAGLPVVATAVGDVPGVVLPGMGSLVPVHRPDTLAAAVCAILDRPDRGLALGKAAQAYIAQHFDVAAWFCRVMTLYGEALGKNAPARISGEAHR